DSLIRLMTRHHTGCRSPPVADAPRLVLLRSRLASTLCFSPENPIIYSADPPLGFTSWRTTVALAGRNLMPRRSLLAVAVLLGICALLAVRFDTTRAKGQSPSPSAPPRFLPGVQPGGSVLLP